MEKRFITFLKKIIKKLQENLGDEYQIEVKEMEGINNTVKHSLWLIHPDRDIHPCIHLDAYFEQYKLGTKINYMVQEILKRCKEDSSVKLSSISNFTSWENVKPHIYAKLIHTESNRGLLSKIPNRAYLDLSFVYYVRLESVVNEEYAVIQISNEHMEYWSVKEDMLYQVAWINTINPNEAVIKNIEDILNPVFSAKEFQNAEKGDGLQMYVLSNKYHINGAVQMCNHDLLRKAAKALEDDFWILPSSVHEVILLPVCQTDDCATGLAEIVREINDTQVELQEILSYHIYYYNRISEETIIAV